MAPLAHAVAARAAIVILLRNIIPPSRLVHHARIVRVRKGRSREVMGGVWAHEHHGARSYPSRPFHRTIRTTIDLDGTATRRSPALQLAPWNCSGRTISGCPKRLLA